MLTQQSYAHYDGSKNHRGYAIGKDAIPKLVYTQKPGRLSQYERDQLQSKVFGKLKGLDGTVKGLLETKRRLAQSTYLPRDKFGNQTSNQTVNDMLAANIHAVDSMIKVALRGDGKKGDSE